MSTDNKGEGSRLPPKHQPDADGPTFNVNQVTPANRETTHTANAEILVELYDVGLAARDALVYIPRTREMPDCVEYRDQTYVFWDTTKNPPQYVRAFTAQGRATPSTAPPKGENNETS
jgi:hypothetical protein